MCVQDRARRRPSFSQACVCSGLKNPEVPYKQGSCEADVRCSGPRYCSPASCALCALSVVLPGTQPWAPQPWLGRVLRSREKESCSLAELRAEDLELEAFSCLHQDAARVAVILEGV